jgi:lysophospholipase L1-like esterase
VVLFTGTNDLCDTPHQEIANIFRSIVNYIRAESPETRIAIAGIIPRPCDEGNKNMLEARTNTNSALAYLSKRLNVEYFKTEICFHDKGPAHLIYRPDGIHLENYGVGILKTLLEGKIASLIGVPPQWDPILHQIIPKCLKRKKSATKSAKKKKLT